MFAEVLKRKSRSLRVLGGFFAAVVTVSLLVPAGAWAQRSEAELAKLFESKPVQIIVGSAPGGGYDVFSRLVARFVGKHLPGNPSFIVRNVPGAGQLRGLRRSMKAKPDGLTLGLLHPRFVQRELAGRDVPDFDLKTVRVLGSPSSGEVPRIWCVRRSIGASYADLVKRGQPVTSGGNAPGAAFGIGPQFVMEMGGPIKMVYGYGGTSEIMAAFDRDEMEGIDRCVRENVPRLFPNWITDKKVAPIFWWEKEPSKDWLGQIGATKVPHIFEVVKSTEEQQNAFLVAQRFNTFSRIFVLQPKVPDDAYGAWKKAFEATVTDPGFLKGAEVAGLDVALGTAEDFNDGLKRYESLTKNGEALLKKLMGIN